MNMPADIIHSILEPVVGWSAFIDERPAEQKDCITVYNTGGSDPIMLMGAKNQDIYNPTVLVQVVGISKPDAYEKADLVRKTLNRIDEFENTEEIYCGIFMQGDILYIGKLDDDQHIYNINFRIIREEKP